MHMLRIIKKQLPIGLEGWKSVQLRRGTEFPGCGRTALTRNHSTLCCKAEDGKHAKQIKHLVGNKTTLGDVEEELNLEEVEFGESGANPEPSDGSEEDRVTASTATQSFTIKRRGCSSFLWIPRSSWVLSCQKSGQFAVAHLINLSRASTETLFTHAWLDQLPQFWFCFSQWDASKPSAAAQMCSSPSSRHSAATALMCLLMPSPSDDQAPIAVG